MTWRRILNVINPVDLITLAYIIVTGVFVFFSAAKIESAWVHLTMRLGMAGLILLLIWLDYLRSNKFIRFVHSFYPLALLGFFYSETDALNNVFFYNMDPWVADIEVTLFHSHPSVLFSKLMPWHWFSEIMYAGYFSFYPLIFALCLYIYLKRFEDFGYTVFVICFSFYLYYILFILFPVAGPQFYFTVPENEVPEGYVFAHIQQIVHTIGERPTAAFPSSHVGVLCLLWYLCAKYVPQWLKWYIPIGIILILSTVYIKAHYVIDVIAGVLTVPTMYWLSKRLYEFITHGLSQELPLMRYYILTKGVVKDYLKRLRKKK
jgi:membrane-associated phospholipid phosphatase